MWQASPHPSLTLLAACKLNSDFLSSSQTARPRSYTMLTRNMRYFSVLGISAHDPFAALPIT